MSATNEADVNTKTLRELLPEGLKNTPDEFITEVLKANNSDLNKAYEDLLSRLERSNWEAVDTKKKKPEKAQGDNTFQTASAPGRGRGRGRGDGPRGTGDGPRPTSAPGGRGGRDRGPAPQNSRGGARNVGGKPSGNDPAAVRATPLTVADVGDKKPVPAPAAPEKPPMPEPAPVPASNQWAKGKPRIENPQPEKEKIPPPVIPQAQPQHVPVQAPVQTIQQPAQPPPPQPQPQQAQAQQPAAPAVSSSEIHPPVEQAPAASASWGTPPVEAAPAKVPVHPSNGGSVASAHTQAHTAPAVPGGGRSAEPIDKNQDSRYRERSAPTTEESMRSNFASLNVGQAAKIDSAVSTPASNAAIQPNAGLAFASPTAEAQTMYNQMQNQMQPVPAQGGYPSQAYPAQFSGYSQQYSQMQSNFQQPQEGEDFSSGRMGNMGMSEAQGYGLGSEAGVAPRGGSNSYGNKGGHAKQAQQGPQQPGIGMQGGWQQQPLLNQYPNLMNTAAMYPQYMAGMAPAQQMMYMQYSGMGGMGMYPGVPGQMYNGTPAYAAQQNTGMATKQGYNAQNQKQKQQYSGGNYGGVPAYQSAQYNQQEPAAGNTQDYYNKNQAATSAAYGGNYGFNYPGGQMGVPFDSMTGYSAGQQQGTQAPYAGRGSGLAAGANGGGSSMDYYPFGGYGAQADDQSQSQSQWRGGASSSGGGRDRGQGQ